MIDLANFKAPRGRRRQALTAEQQTVMNGVIARVNAGEKLTVVHGLAGTGKTTILAELKRHHFPDAFLCSKYGKAADVMRRKTRSETSTIDSAIYRITGRHTETNELIKTDRQFYRSLVFLDETSVVGKADAIKLLSKADQVVAFGDPGQLPPINDTPYFTEPNFMLTEIMRQGSDSPIIEEAHRVLHNWTFQDRGHPDFRVVEKETERQLMQAKVILCHTNGHRRLLTFQKRALLGYNDLGSLYPGEPLMCLQNNKQIGLFNGSLVTVLKRWMPGAPLHVHSEDTHENYQIPCAAVEWFSRGFDPKTPGRKQVPFTPGYACTVTKSQGSEWPSVLLFEGSVRREEYNKTMYTAITRAQKSIVIVKEPDDGLNIGEFANA